MGPCIRHGAHHGAQKSTRVIPLLVSEAKLLIFISNSLLNRNPFLKYSDYFMMSVYILYATFISPFYFYVYECEEIKSERIDIPSLFSTMVINHA
jgi:hypothetical protein